MSEALERDVAKLEAFARQATPEQMAKQRSYALFARRVSMGLLCLTPAALVAGILVEGFPAGMVAMLPFSTGALVFGLMGDRSTALLAMSCALGPQA